MRYRAVCQSVADRLHLHHGQVRLSRRFPQSQKADRADAGPEIEQPEGLWLGTDRRPGCQQVIGGEPVAVAKLKDPPAPGQSIQGGFTIFLTVQRKFHLSTSGCRTRRMGELEENISASVASRGFESIDRWA